MVGFKITLSGKEIDKERPGAFSGKILVETKGDYGINLTDYGQNDMLEADIEI